MSTAAKQVDRLANYIPVNERLEQFYTEHPSGRVLTSVLEHSAEQGFILMRAEIYRSQEDAMPAATGHAFENRNQGYVNQTSYIENCETSAVGRGLALMGYEIKRGIASREEMEKVQRMTAVKPVPDHPKQDSVERATLMDGVTKACKLLNEAGDTPEWSKARLREFVLTEFGAASVDDMGLVEVRELIKKLSLRLDKLNDGRPNKLDNMPTVPRCDCGIQMVHKAGGTKGKAWSGYFCANRVKEHKTIFDKYVKTVQPEPEEYDPSEGGDY